MKKYLSLIIIIVLYSCSSTKSSINRPLYEVLAVNTTGGANIKFYETLTEPKEIKMLLGDEALRKLIKEKDIAKIKKTTLWVVHLNVMNLLKT